MTVAQHLMLAELSHGRATRIEAIAYGGAEHKTLDALVRRSLVTFDDMGRCRITERGEKRLARDLT